MHRRLARWVAMGVWLFLGLACLWLFVASAGIVPERFTSWQNLGCGPWGPKGDDFLRKTGLPPFVQLTDCGRAYVVRTDLQPTFSNESILAFYDVWTDKKLGEISLKTLSPKVLSSDRKVLMAEDWLDGLLIRELASGKDLARIPASDGFPQFHFNRAGNRALTRTESGGTVWNLESGEALSSFELPRKRFSFAFCTASGKARCFTIGDDLEIWDEQNSTRLFILPGVSGGHPDQMPFCLSPDSRKLAMATDGGILVWSVEDGALIRTLPIFGWLLSNCGYNGSALTPHETNISFSNDSRWLAEQYHWTDPIVAKSSALNFRLGGVIATCLPERNLAALVYLDSGQTWSGMPAGHGVAFSDDDSRMVTFGDEGRYEWSVPPRRQWCTPWAWVALAAWLIPCGIWWKSRARRRCG
jgi:hypothetical protein